MWEERISPVFDSARTLLIAEIRNTEISKRSYQKFTPDNFLHLQQILKAQEVSIIICGAVSKRYANMLEAADVELIPFIAGNVEEILSVYIQGNSVWSKFRMPGCGKNVCCQGKIRRGRQI